MRWAVYRVTLHGALELPARWRWRWRCCARVHAALLEHVVGMRVTIRRAP